MANNPPQFPGIQPHQPRLIAHVPPPIPPMYQQFRPLIPPPVPPPFVPVALLPPPPPLPPPPLQRPAQPQIPNNFTPGFGGPVISHTPYNLPPSSGGPQQMYVGSTPQRPWFTIPNQSMQNAWFSTVKQNVYPVTTLQHNDEQNGGPQQSFRNENQNVQFGKLSQNTEEQNTGMVKNTIPEEAVNVLSDWRECIRDGKKYYYNKRTKISSWEKPMELMTPNERADASTDWREFNTPEGRSYYFNNVTKQSKWQIPDELKLARERFKTSLCEQMPKIEAVNSNLTENNSSPVDKNMVSSPLALTPGVNPEPVVACGPLDEVANLNSDATVITPLETATSAVLSKPASISTASGITTPMEISIVLSNDLQEANKRIEISSSEGINTTEGKIIEPLVYYNEEEAKNAFKALLESVNVGSDWNWEQAMRVIINDRRYGALRTLGKRKQTFNEFVGRKKKQEAEQKRARNKKAKEDFKKMLEESEDLTSSTRWSKAISMFEKDERFLAVDRVKDREDIFDDHLKDLKKKNKAKALEEHKRHQTEYLDFLKSCDFIKASSQWRKVQHRLEADERCTRLDKFERLEIFQEYVRDLELEEEEKKKLRMEEQRKIERKNRDEFRKLMEQHVTNGVLTAKSHWREYCTKVKDAPAYLAVSSNTSGSTAKDLFTDVIEDLQKQYSEDKEEIEDAIKDGKISLSTNWSLEDFKSAVLKEISTKTISDFNLKLIFTELIEMTKEKEEKEAKKRKRLAEEVYNFLLNSKEITSSSKWEDCKPLVEERFVGEESFFLEIFDKVIPELKEKSKDKDRKLKNEKAKKEKKRKIKKRKNKKRHHRSSSGSKKSKQFG